MPPQQRTVAHHPHHDTPGWYPDGAGNYLISAWHPDATNSDHFSTSPVNFIIPTERGNPELVSFEPPLMKFEETESNTNSSLSTLYS